MVLFWFAYPKVIEATHHVTVTNNPEFTGQMTHYINGVRYWENYIVIRDESGEILFCVDPKTSIYGGQYEVSEMNSIQDIQDYIRLTPELQKRLELVAYFGYQTQPSWANLQYTQGLVYETLGSDRFSFSGKLSNEGYEAFKQRVLQKINQYKTTTSWSGLKLSLKVGERHTLLDEHDVLDQLTVSNSRGFIIEENGNQLTIQATKQSESGTVLFHQKDQQYYGTSFIYRKDKEQSLGKFRVKDPLLARLEIEVQKQGEIHILKRDRSTKQELEGVAFAIYEKGSAQALEEKVTDKSGMIRFENLDSEKEYEIKEKTGKDGYIDAFYTHVATVEAGVTTLLEVWNDPIPVITSSATTVQKEKEGYVFEQHVETIQLARLVEKERYTLLSVQYDETGKEQARQMRSFVASSTTHTETFHYDVPDNAGQLVFYGAYLEKDNRTIASHKHRENADQKIRMLHPIIETVARTSSGESLVYAHQPIMETVKIIGMKPNKQHTLKIKFIDLHTKSPVWEDEFAIWSDTGIYEHSFELVVPEKVLGEELVLTEELLYEGKVVATHCDLTNELQTVRLLTPRIQTEVLSPFKSIQKGTYSAIRDRISYAGFKEGEVLIRTWIVKKGTNQRVCDIQEMIVPFGYEGEWEQEIAVDAIAHLEAGEYTIMEQIYEIDSTRQPVHLLAEHVDVNDARQSFVVLEKDELPQLGMSAPYGTLGAWLCVVGGIVFIFFAKRKNV